MNKLDAYTRLADLRNKNELKAIPLLELEQNIKQGRPQIINSFNLFQTPQEIVRRMISLVVTSEKHILEPSAGLGRLIHPVQDAASITAIDISHDCTEYLFNKYPKIKQVIRGDFLTLDLPNFDLAIMNPPFKNGIDIKHILKAKELCKEVVFLCTGGPRQERILKPITRHWELLPPGSFKESGTNVNVFLGLI